MYSVILDRYGKKIYIGKKMALRRWLHLHKSFASSHQIDWEWMTELALNLLDIFVQNTCFRIIWSIVKFNENYLYWLQLNEETTGFHKRRQCNAQKKVSIMKNKYIYIYCLLHLVMKDTSKGITCRSFW